MSKQTTFGSGEGNDQDRTAEGPRGEQRAGGKRSSVNGATSSSSTTDAKSNVSRHGSEEIETWVAEQKARGENFGYGHLFAERRSDLNGVRYRLGWEARIARPAPQSEATSSASAGFKTSESSSGFDTLVNWKLSQLATPYHPQLRDVPVTDLRVFVADVAYERLCDQGHPVEAVLERLRELPEHRPSEADLEARREELRLKRKGGIQGTLNSRKNAIEQTVRARFGFTSRYGHTVPDPDVRFADLSLPALKHRLEATREWLDRASERLAELRDQRRAERAEWIAQTKAQRFPELSDE